jgi:hypothetical protein
MNLPDYTFWLFMMIVVLLVMIFLFPSNLTIGLGVVMSSLIIVFQAILILKDPSTSASDTYDV